MGGGVQPRKLPCSIPPSTLPRTQWRCEGAAGTPVLSAQLYIPTEPTCEMRMTHQNARHTPAFLPKKQTKNTQDKGPFTTSYPTDWIMDGVVVHPRRRACLMPSFFLSLSSVGGSITGHLRVAFLTKATKMTLIRAL